MLCKLPTDLQLEIIEADWSGIRFGLTCRKYACIVKAHEKYLRKKFARKESISLGTGSILMADRMPNGIYHGRAIVQDKNGKITNNYKYRNNKIIKYKGKFDDDWKYIKQIGNAKYIFSYEYFDPEDDTVAAEHYDANPTAIDLFDEPVFMATYGGWARLTALYQYIAGDIIVEINWGDKKVNARATVTKKCECCLVPGTPKTLCRVFPYEIHKPIWKNDRPNWSHLQDAADGYFRRFVRDEKLWRISTSRDDNNHIIDFVPAPFDTVLPPGIRGSTF